MVGLAVGVDLPDEALFNIFSKLALQDPATLLAASAACKNFHTVASSHASLWRSAFYGLSDPPDSQEPEAAAFQDVVKHFGGYETLVRARWAKQASARKKTELACFEESLTKLQIGSQYDVRLLVFLRTTQGRLCLYGEGQASCRWGSQTYFCIKIDQLRPLFPTRTLPVELVTRVPWVDVDIKLECYTAFEGGSINWVPLRRGSVRDCLSRQLGFEAVANVRRNRTKSGKRRSRRKIVPFCVHATLEDSHYRQYRNSCEDAAIDRVRSNGSVNWTPLEPPVEFELRLSGHCGGRVKRPNPVCWESETDFSLTSTEYIWCDHCGLSLDGLRQ